MKGRVRNLIGFSVVCLIAAGLGACSSTVKSVRSVDADETAVFGKFQLVRNGENVKLGDSFFANSATLHFVSDADGEPIVGHVGRDGEFAWILQPGEYHVASVGFIQHGKTVTPRMELVFNVEPGDKAVYVGTITLYTSIDSGYFGDDAVVESYTVTDACEQDCADRMAALGFEGMDPTVSLLHRERRVATTR